MVEVQGDNGRNRAMFKNWSDALFIDLDQGGWARSPILLTSSLKR